MRYIATLELHHVRLRSSKVAYTRSARMCVRHDDLERHESDHSLKTLLQTHHRTASRRVLNCYSTLATNNILRATQATKEV